ncbi:MAG: hypothetical protein KDB07_02270, partial [Planctomycetes bacterium]|nr:hypothetical protein [Planctomycetota bacterium]
LNPEGIVASANVALQLAVLPTAEQSILIKALGKKDAEAEKKANQPIVDRPNQKSTKEPALQWSSIMWLLAVLFGVGFFISIVWMSRSDEKRQLRNATLVELDEDTVQSELEAMRKEVEAGKLPPQVYLDERNRIIEGLMTAKRLRAEEKQADKDAPR